MCWNADISLNTFIFGCFALSFIYITNTYTKYKTHTFDNPLVYLFMFAVISMQLTEYFLWKNMKNKSLNQYYSKIAWLVVLSQPLILMLMIQGLGRYVMIGIYILFGMIFPFLYPNFGDSNFYTTVGKNGHLIWEWMSSKDPLKDKLVYLHIFCWLLYIVPLLLIRNTLLTLFCIGSLLLSIFFYYTQGTFGTMWCWSVNLFLLYFVVHILVIQPFLEYNSLC